MCLILRERVRGKGSTSGYGYKIVKVDGDNMFNFYRNAQPTCYEIGVATEVTDKKYIHDDYGNKYRCAIHLYVNPVDSFGVSWFSRLAGRTNMKVALILCKYEKATVTDKEQIVALKVTPIRVLQQSE